MREAKIRILNEQEYTDTQREFATNYFKQRIRAHLVPIMVSEDRPFPDLKDGVVYFVVALTVDGARGLETQYALIQLPAASAAVCHFALGRGRAQRHFHR